LPDWLRIVDGLYAVPVVQPKGMSPITFELLISTKPESPDAAKFVGQISDGNQQLAKLSQALAQSLEEVHGIDQYITKTVSATNAVDFEVLEKTLLEMLSAIKPFVARPNAAAAAAAGSGAEALVSGISVRGSIRCRADVVQALDTICEYYRQVEPCSPVPFLLRRAQKLANMDFVQALQELNLATIEALRPSMGSLAESVRPPAGGA
jgi:type VI secretion system protein ImpA